MNDKFVYLNDDLQNKINVALNSVFIGDIEFLDEEINDIKNFVLFSYEDKENYKNNKLFKNALLILIINFSKKWGDDDTDRYFYRKVFDYIFEDKELTLTNFDLIDYWTCDLKRIWLKDNSGNTTRYKQTLLFNAFSPKNSIYSFIDIIQDAFFDETNINTGFFDKDFETDSYPYLRFVKAYASKFLNISDEDENVTIYGGTYKLATALRHGFIYDTKSVAKLVSRTVGYIRKFYNKEPINDDSYFARLAIDHLARNIHELNANSKMAYVEKVQSVDSWYAYYYFSKNNHLYIKMPVLRMESFEQYGDHLTVSIRTQEQKYNDFKQVQLKGNDYNLYVDEISFDITKAVRLCNDKFDFVINVFDAHNRLIFTTDTKLFRDFLIFEQGNNKEIKNEYLDPMSGQFMAVVPEYFTLDINENSRIDFKEMFEYNPCYLLLEPKLGNYINGREKQVVFVDPSDKNTFKIEGEIVPNLLYEFGSFSYKVYKSINSLDIAVTRDLLNGKDFKIEWEIINNETSKKIIEDISLLDYSKAYITLSKTNHSAICNNGLIRFKLINNDSKKIILKGGFYIANLGTSFTPYLPNESGLHELIIFGLDETLFSNFVFASPFGIDIVLADSAFRYLTPYLNYSIKGVDDNKPNVLKKDNCKNIFYKKINAEFPVLRVNSSYSNVTVLVNNVPLNGENNKYKIENLNKLIPGRNETVISVLIDKTKYDIYKIFYSEFIQNNVFNIEFDGNRFSYYLGTFIGEDEPCFEIVIFDIDENDEYTIEVGHKIISEFNGTFELENFEDGYYTVKLFKLNKTGEDFYRGKVLVSLDEIELGNADKTQFDDCTINLIKTSNKEKLHDCNIDSIRYCFRNEFPVYTGTLKQNNVKSLKVFIEAREGTLALFSDYESYEPLYYNRETKKLVVHKDNKTTEVRSCYYDIEE